MQKLDYLRKNGDFRLRNRKESDTKAIMICAYCHKEKKKSREHIISKSVLDLFPECFLTCGISEGKVHEADPVINDVCTDCNSQMSYIDTYARDVIRKYFLQKYEPDSTVPFVYNFAMMQKVLLQYAYNDQRAHKCEAPFFDDEIIRFLLNEEENEARKNVLILAGTVANTTPAHDFMFGNLKLQLCQNPKLFDSTVVRYINYNTAEFILNDEIKIKEIKDLVLSYVFRFNSGQFVLLCFKKGSDEIKNQRLLLPISYPYKLLSEIGNDVLSLCTSYFSYIHPWMIHLRWDPAYELSYFSEAAKKDGGNNWNELESKFLSYEEQLRQEHKR